MILTDYRFLLDVHEINSQISLSFKQGDTGRVLYITLTENGDIFNIPQSCVAVFTALKPDGTIIFNDCEINGNEIVYTHTAQTAAVTGKVDCELRLYGAGNTLITSPHFTIFVHPTVYADQIVSEDEINTLTNLISEASTFLRDANTELDSLVENVNAKLDNGDFIPQMKIGTVATLPAGTMATAEFTGTGAAPVLNLGIPQGPVGTNEELIPDTELSLESTRPVQNRIVTAALNTKADAEATAQALNTKADAEATARALNTKADAEATARALETKVPKEDGKQLSTNDYTNEEKEKLRGIAENANNYSLPIGGETLGGVKNGGDIVIDETGNINIPEKQVKTAMLDDSAVTAAKLSADAKSRGVAVTLASGSWSSNSQTVNVEGVTVDNNILVAAAPASRTVWNDAEIYCSAQGAGTLTFACSSAPTADVTANVIILV